MLEKIKALEAEARKLEPDAAKRAEDRSKVLDYTEDFLNRIYELKAYNVTETKGEGVYDSPISETPDNIDHLIDIVREQIDTPGLNPASGGHLGYIPGGGLYYSALGDYMADVMNRYSGVYFASPGAVRLENMLIDWGCQYDWIYRTVCRQPHKREVVSPI